MDWSKLIPLYEKMFCQQAAQEKFGDERAMFWPCQGSQYNRELMVVGRATNGWHPYYYEDVIDEAGRTRIIEHLISSTYSNECPLQWVINHWASKSKTEYNSKKSAFWRVIKQIQLQYLGVCEENWASHLAWSNLYKLAGKEGNPSNYLIKIQLDICKQILTEEIKLFEPKRLLFLTGWNWAEHFSGVFGERTIEMVFNEDSLVDRSFLSQGSTLVVVAKHPQGKKENIWVTEVIREFERLNREYINPKY